MTDVQLITNWLKNNTTLSWTRTGGDQPAVKLDRIYINRSEAYEIRDFIIKLCSEGNYQHSEKNYAIFFKDINAYNPGQKVTSQELLSYLLSKYKG
ncbi:hypothetical protein [Vibrio tritonius]|uniref:hypothetical protein n=1 Tax=Vibrio tritonius TaxID=1435069 RepID=UPI00315D7950